ncbi:alpha-L-arabinofuranosidase C-terminus-domain-containing protein [Lentinula detonsa]|uniref:Alpha-L-arabinofuranosidase C-terminus-domain-containing protein n=1 Tax=Lentinula detonsa TaxID=2804962 RepID=A0A9W8NWY4_9AGAR|nr:alpha-L-arabinofuranosidase C-terminus-domain-containing protein [Lentinula detonsa]
MAPSTLISCRGTDFNFQGEYATTTENSGAALTYPFIDGSIAEVAYMAGFDRNSDIVFAASYAPLLNHVSSTQWTPDLITFSPNTAIRSASYHLQQLYSLYKGDFFLRSTTNTIPTPFTPSHTTGTGTILNAPSGTQNTPTSPNAAVPSTSSFTAGKTITYNAPGLSLSVLVVTE